MTVTFVTREGARARLGKGLGMLGGTGKGEEDAANRSPLAVPLAVQGLRRDSLGDASSDGGDFPLLGFYSAPFLQTRSFPSYPNSLQSHPGSHLLAGSRSGTEASV